MLKWFYYPLRWVAVIALGWVLLSVSKDLTWHDWEFPVLYNMHADSIASLKKAFGPMLLLLVTVFGEIDLLTKRVVALEQVVRDLRNGGS